MERLTFAVSGSKVEGRTLSGIAHVYGSVSTKYGGEKFAPGAFSKSIAGGNVASFAYHDSSKLLATQAAGTLRLSDGPQGMGFEIDLPEGVSYAEDIRALIAGGHKMGMSIQVPRVGAKSTVKAGVRTFTEVLLASADPVLDTSVIGPAFEGTSVMLHSQESEPAYSQAIKLRARRLVEKVIPTL